MIKRIVAGVAALSLILSLAACSSGEPQAADTTSDPSTAQSESDASSTADATETDTRETLTDYAANMFDSIADLEDGSSARVDAIISLAKDDAEIAGTSIAADAATTIIDNYPAYYSNAADMELYIYLGSLLEYSMGSDNDYGRLGQYTVEAIKYVYRGVESSTDQATLDKLAQVKELADTL